MTRSTQAKPVVECTSRRIAGELRRGIISGTLAPGARLPTRNELEQRYATTRMTVQKALAQLERDGYVVSRRGRAGTFVSARPPHLGRFGLVFPERRSFGSPEAGIYNAMVLASRGLEQDGKATFTVYLDELGQEGSAEFARLVEDVRLERLAGLIFAHPARTLEKTRLWPFLADGRMPCAVLESAAPSVGGWLRFEEDIVLSAKAVARLKAVGRERVAVLFGSQAYINVPEAWDAACREFGLEVRRCRFQAVPLGSPQWARNAAELLMLAKPALRPDALVIADDNLVKWATLGLQDAGVRVPEDVLVIAHTNFPLYPPASVPVERLGFDIRRLLRGGVDLITGARLGTPATASVTIPVQWEHEIS